VWAGQGRRKWARCPMNFKRAAPGALEKEQLRNAGGSGGSLP
jgi:hypothetical protein